MLDQAAGVFADAAISEVTRVDVPGRGASEPSDGGIRDEIETVIPALQSGSLFGGTHGVLIVDAQNLHKAESEALAELASGLDEAALLAVFVAMGSLPATLAAVVRDEGELARVKALREADAVAWLRQAARDRGLRIDSEAVAALVQRFGSDVGAIGQALDQLAAADEPITAEMVVSRFRNRPDEPMWLLADAIAAGDSDQALRRLADFVTYGHPLQLLAFLEGDLKRRSLAAAAPDLETLAAWSGTSPEHYPTKKAWKSRDRASQGDLRRALDAISRADILLKTMPEATHRLTMERLTVALTRWYRGGSSPRS